MADLGDIGLAQSDARMSRCSGAFTYNKSPTNVIIHIDDALPYAGGTQTSPVYFFTQNGTKIDSADVDDLGNAYTYDLDDGSYYANQIGTGNTWSINVIGTTVTITRLASFGNLITVYAA